MIRRTTVRSLLAAIAGTAVVLGAWLAGRRTEQLSRPRADEAKEGK